MPLNFHRSSCFHLQSAGLRRICTWLMQCQEQTLGLWILGKPSANWATFSPQWHRPVRNSLIFFLFVWYFVACFLQVVRIVVFASGHCGSYRPATQCPECESQHTCPRHLWTVAASEKTLELRWELSLLLTQKRTQHPFRIRFAVTLMFGTLEAHSSLVTRCLLVRNNRCSLLFLSPGWSSHPSVFL